MLMETVSSRDRDSASQQMIIRESLIQERDNPKSNNKWKGKGQSILLTILMMIATQIDPTLMVPEIWHLTKLRL